MASANQIKALLSSFRDGDDERFLAVAMQLAAHQARIGHENVAKELRDLVDQAKLERGKGAYKRERGPVPIRQPKGELSGLLTLSYPEERLEHLIVDPELRTKLGRLIKEYAHLDKIRSYGLSPRRKLLLVGPPGTGKTMSASVLAGELSLPLFVVRFEALLTRFMGETAAKLAQIFAHIATHRGVYLFDEFDSIGSMRTLRNDVGEIRRVLNSFLQLIEQDSSDSLVLAATNHPSMLDIALFRRFDDILEFTAPDVKQIRAVLEARLSLLPVAPALRWTATLKLAEGLSHSEICRACDEAIKSSIIDGKSSIDREEVEHQLKERRKIRSQNFSGE